MKKSSAYMRMVAKRFDANAPWETMAYSLLMAVCALYDECGDDSADAIIAIVLAAKDCLAKMTPTKMLQTFPLDKVYDGEKYECKDYFSSMEAVAAMPPDEPIGAENIDSLLWDYNSRYVRKFVLAEMMAIDRLRHRQGKKGMMEEWLDDKGITPIYRYETDDGRGYFYDPVTGKTMRERVRAPWKYKVIRGGK